MLFAPRAASSKPEEQSIRVMNRSSGCKWKCCLKQQGEDKPLFPSHSTADGTWWMEKWWKTALVCRAGDGARVGGCPGLLLCSSSNPTWSSTWATTCPEAWAGVPVPLTWMRSSVGTAQPSKGVRSTVPTASASRLGPCI